MTSWTSSCSSATRTPLRPVASVEAVVAVGAELSAGRSVELERLASALWSFWLLLGGAFLAALITQALSKYGVSLELPLAELAVFTTVAIAAGVLAAIVPARRASRINVLNALQYE